jgi:diaminohydroxyphosphoribosylaminopyrimidine deaminase / 5-amino-6-(5-phosphoribosylamino)uracil reductase
MTRALELAAAAPFTSPNPRVGAVLVRGDEIVGEGAHLGAGTPHAEVIALEGVDATGSTLYVNLEPCTHQGRMPPCAPAVVAAGVARVVIATTDPDPRVAGDGISFLRARGLDVTVGIGATKAEELNVAYLHQRRTGRPLLTLKLALSLDGKLAAADGTSRWITGEEARRHVHRRRLEVDGVLVGAGTVVVDDPGLTVRDIDAPRQPVRVLIDASGRIPASARAFGEGEVVVMTTIASPHAVRTQWKEAGADVVVVGEAEPGEVDLRAVIDNLASRGWLEIYCEGGAQLATSLLRADLVDRLELYYGPVIMGGTGIGLGDLGVETIADAAGWKTISSTRLGPDTAIVMQRTS